MGTCFTLGSPGVRPFLPHLPIHWLLVTRILSLPVPLPVATFLWALQDPDPPSLFKKSFLESQVVTFTPIYYTPCHIAEGHGLLAPPQEACLLHSCHYPWSRTWAAPAASSPPPRLMYRVATGTRLSHAPGLALREARVSHSLRRALTHPAVAASGEVCMSEITMAAQYGCTSQQEGLGAPFDLGMSLPQRGHSLAQADCPDSYICVWLRKKMI